MSARDEEFLDLNKAAEPVEEVSTTTSAERRKPGRTPRLPAAALDPEPVEEVLGTTSVSADDEFDGDDEPDVAEAHPVLSADEINTALARARAEVVAEQKKAAIKRVVDEEKARLRREEGLVTGDRRKDQMVRITLDLAEHSARITLNGQPYWHGFTYTVPRHVADTLRDVQSRGWVHQDEADGKDRAQHYQANRRARIERLPDRTRLNMRTGGVTGAPVNHGLADATGRVLEATHAE